jgi:pyruvate/2-oxoglutarate dehydrogenase complex dihydrolipoamide acyltransferase (E2) component
MAIVEVILPKWGLTMEEGILVDWEIKEGDLVAEGQVIVHVETDKVVNDLEAPVTGVVKSIKYKAGTEGIPVGAVLCEIEEG